MKNYPYRFFVKVRFGDMSYPNSTYGDIVERCITLEEAETKKKEYEDSEYIPDTKYWIEPVPEKFFSDRNKK